MRSLLEAAQAFERQGAELRHAIAYAASPCMSFSTFRCESCIRQENECIQRVVEAAHAARQVLRLTGDIGDES